MKQKILVIFVCLLMMLVTSLVVTGQTNQINQHKKVSPNDILRIDKICEIPISYQFWNEYEPSIDVEKYVWDPKIEEWIDADTENEALDIKPCRDITFKVVIYNVGDCPLFNITIRDTMTDGLKFISGDPEPNDFLYEPPYYNMSWYFPGPLEPTQTFEIYITSHVEGPYCSVDFNRALAEGECLHGNLVDDEDYAYVHPKRWNERVVYTPFLKFIQNLPNQLIMLQKLLQQLGFRL
jgi:hypothetical protein